MVRRFGSFSGLATLLVALGAGCSASPTPPAAAPPSVVADAGAGASSAGGAVAEQTSPPTASASICPPPAAATATPATTAAPPAEPTAKPAVDDATAKAASAPPERPMFVSIVDDLPHALPKPGHTKKTAHATAAHHKNSKQTGGSDPHVTVSVVATEGQPSLLRTSRSKEAQFRTCYEPGLRRDQDMKGELEIQLTLAADGRVEQSKLLSTSLGDPNVEMCIVREASGLVFADPRGAAHAFSVRVALHPGDDPVATPTPLPHADAIEEDLAKVRPEVEQCYRDGLSRRLGLGGPLSLKFKVRPSGEVFEIGESETHFGDMDTTRCITRAFRANKLPPSHAKGSKKDSTFVYTLHLEADGPPATSRAN